MSVFFWILMGLTWIGGVISMISDNFQNSFDAVKEVLQERKYNYGKYSGHGRLQYSKMQRNFIAVESARCKGMDSKMHANSLIWLLMIAFV